MRTWFVTGTDTEVGKTVATVAMVRELIRSGQRVAALKPVASGCEPTPLGLRNEDALALAGAANVSLTYGQVNPFAFQPPIAPHLAAHEARQAIEPLTILQSRDRAAELGADWLLVEGVGGWSVPLGNQLLLADLARALTDEVVLVVGMRLGCLNHAMLSASQVLRDGFRLVGWIANELHPTMDRLQDNVETLESRLPCPLLGRIPWSQAVPLRPDARWREGWSDSLPAGISCPDDNA
jgi:dethiobiotin synthetase